MAILLGIVAPSACPFAAGATVMPSRPPSSAAAAGMPLILPAAAADGDLEALARSAATEDGDLEALGRSAAADDDVEVLARPASADDDVEVLARPAARAEAERGWLRRIKIKSPAFLFRRVFSGVARAGDILGGAYRRSFVAGYIVEFTALCTTTYRRSVVAVYVAEFFSLCARSWRALGVVFNPLPAGSQLLPISDPSERLCFVLDMERLQLLVLSVLVLGAVLFVSLEILVLAGVITRYEQYWGILKFVFTILQRLMVAYKKTCDFYNDIEWLRMDVSRDRQLHPPPVGEQQQIPPPVGEQQQQLPALATEQQQLPPLAAEQQQLPPPAAKQQQLPPLTAEQLLLPPPLPPEMDIY